MVIHGVYRDSKLTMCYLPVARFLSEELTNIERNLEGVTCGDCQEINRKQLKELMIRNKKVKV